eukprot:scaffold1021_cov241-Pinguiococcus_pyrenoidosus.AAC.2
MHRDLHLHVAAAEGQRLAHLLLASIETHLGEGAFPQGLPHLVVLVALIATQEIEHGFHRPSSGRGSKGEVGWRDGSPESQDAADSQAREADSGLLPSVSRDRGRG